jgi:hypothetical protein
MALRVTWHGPHLLWYFGLAAYMQFPVHRGDRGVPSRSVDKVRGVPRRPPMRADTIPDFEGMRGGTGSRARPVPRAGWFCPGVRDSQRFPVGNRRGRMEQSEIRTPGDSVAAGSRGPATTLYEGSRLVLQCGLISSPAAPGACPGRDRGDRRSRACPLSPCRPAARSPCDRSGPCGPLRGSFP